MSPWASTAWGIHFSEDLLTIPLYFVGLGDPFFGGDPIRKAMGGGKECEHPYWQVNSPPLWQNGRVCFDCPQKPILCRAFIKEKGGGK